MIATSPPGKAPLIAPFLITRKMITEDYVSFEIAKLLKEKGFDEYCKSVYHVGSVCSVASLRYHDNEEYGAVIDEKQNSDFGKYDNAISAPTLQMAMKWLREVHHIFIDVDYDIRLGNNPYFTLITDMNKWDYFKGHDLPTEKETYEEACEAAIKYCLENLI